MYHRSGGKFIVVFFYFEFSATKLLKTVRSAAAMGLFSATSVGAAKTVSATISLVSSEH